jgi:Ca-activated chloride channel family protein
MEAAKVAEDLGVRVYSVGMGSSRLAPFPQRGRDGRVRLVQMRVELDEDLLLSIAAATGGRYGRAGTTENLRAIYGEIDRLERTEVEGLTYRRWRELFAWPLGAASLSWLLSLLLEGTLFRRLG